MGMAGWQQGRLRRPPPRLLRLFVFHSFSLALTFLRFLWHPRTSIDTCAYRRIAPLAIIPAYAVVSLSFVLTFGLPGLAPSPCLHLPARRAEDDTGQERHAGGEAGKRVRARGKQRKKQWRESSYEDGQVPPPHSFEEDSTTAVAGIREQHPKRPQAHDAECRRRAAAGEEEEQAVRLTTG